MPLGMSYHEAFSLTPEDQAIWSRSRQFYKYPMMAVRIAELNDAGIMNSLTRGGRLHAPWTKLFMLGLHPPEVL